MLLVAPADAGKTAVLREVSSRTDWSHVNTNLELSRRLLDVSPGRRPLQVYAALAAIVRAVGAGPILLDNIELLFDIALKQDPLRLLQGVARNTTVVAAWNGIVDQGRLVYAVPSHPEFRRYDDLGAVLIVDISPPATGRALIPDPTTRVEIPPQTDADASMGYQHQPLEP